MKEQLVDKETAVLAKEKGFNEPCWDFIDINNQEENVISWIGDTFEEKLELAIYFVKCYRPTQSLLQKWLREKHNLHIHISRLAEGVWNVDIYKLAPIDDILMNNPLEFSNNKSFEDALEVGLYQALKLIK